MKEQVDNLTQLIESLPTFSLTSGYSELNSILYKFTGILNYFNSYNEDYRRATNVYYADLSTIRQDIQESLYAKSYNDKVSAFEAAKKDLRSNMLALIMLAKPAQVSVEPMMA